MTPLQAARLDARALRQRWPMTPEQREAVIKRLVAVMKDPNSKPRAVIAAGRALISAEQQNQNDDHFKDDRSMMERVHKIASDLGIDIAEITSNRRIEETK